MFQVRRKKMQINILDILKDEHTEITQLLNRVMRTPDIKAKKTFFEEMKQKLFAHMEAEEQTLYASLKNEQIDNALYLAEDAEFEHRQVRDYFEMLEDTQFNSEEWNELFREIKSSIEEHIEFEESTLFAEAKEDFTDGELLHFSQNYLETKER